MCDYLSISANQIYSSADTAGQGRPGWQSKLALFTLWSGLPHPGRVSALLLLATVLCQGERNYNCCLLHHTHKNVHCTSCSGERGYFVLFIFSARVQLHVQGTACGALSFTSRSLILFAVLMLLSITLFFPSFPFILGLHAACTAIVGAGIVCPIQVHCSSYLLPHFPCRSKSLCMGLRVALIRRGLVWSVFAVLP